MPPKHESRLRVMFSKAEEIRKKSKEFDRLEKEKSLFYNYDSDYSIYSDLSELSSSETEIIEIKVLKKRIRKLIKKRYHRKNSIEHYIDKKSDECLGVGSENKMCIICLKKPQEQPGRTATETPDQPTEI